MDGQGLFFYSFFSHYSPHHWSQLCLLGIFWCKVLWNSLVHPFLVPICYRSLLCHRWRNVIWSGRALPWSVVKGPKPIAAFMSFSLYFFYFLQKSKTLIFKQNSVFICYATSHNFIPTISFWFLSIWVPQHAQVFYEYSFGYWMNILKIFHYFFL